MWPSGLRTITYEIVDPDPLAYRDDMAHASEMLSGFSDLKTLQYVVHFLQGVEGNTDNSHHSRLAGSVRERTTAEESVI